MKFENKKHILEYNAKDFLEVFEYYYYCYYEKEYLALFPKDTMNMKSALDQFILHGLGNLEFKEFIKWSIDEKAAKKGTRMKVGLLPHLAKEYLKNLGLINIYDKAVKTTKKKMKQDIKDWVAEELKRTDNE